MASSNGQAPGLGREIASVAGIFLALFLFICFGSYSLPTSVGGAELLRSGGEVAVPLGETAAINWGGVVGQVIAGLVMNFLGISAFLLPLLILAVALQSFSPVFSLRRLPVVLLGASGLLLAGSSLAGLGGGNALHLFGNLYPQAGYLGGLLADLGQRILGGPGSLLFFLALFVVSLMLTLEFSPYLFVRRVVSGGRAVVVRLWGSSDSLRGWLGVLVRRRAGRPGVRAGQPGKRGEERRQESPAESKTELPSFNLFEPEPFTLELPPPGNSAEPQDGSKNEAWDLDRDFQLLPPDTPNEYRLPTLDLLDRPASRELNLDKEYYFEVSRQLEEKLADFNVVGKVVGISPGPVITTYEFAPAPGVKINRIVSLAEDLALGLRVESVRIAGSLPGKGAIGIEIPNPERQTVPIRDIFAHESFQKASSRLTIGLGMDVVGNPVVADLAKMPHLLIAGATGSGKSVAVNTIICSILYNATPDQVRLLLVDPKRIELSGYEAIPHLLHPVVVDPKLASRALQWAVREMERRYQLMEEARVKSLAGYNQEAEEKLPLIVIIIDELADLMMVSSREVEDAVARLAQMARAAGMHLILATQRPSVDVLTGLIKANFPTRMSFKVSSKIDSRTILDGSGAEHLLGAGDMLFLPPGAAKLQRIHGAYISEQESQRIVAFLKAQGAAEYDPSVLEIAEEPEEGNGDGEDGTMDEHYDRAVALVTETGQASISMVQRRLRVGYNRAARMIETMEKEGIIGPADGAKPREVLVRKSY
ncbi:FtsK/SpoIIIE family DNA translocase [Desulfurivibrio dismutans]|uniref:FtsK/SpoIIIE family DNA translocase n=1 Tax=Desulfurivibrio dismutans TaxID=1398908 RepID=UPI0023DBFB56|nr:DNA translocase FtsK 4TM domain-containing protein [Desulfurivibrio alkaliphilus]MDF1613642.1 DNA translocase FtsK 4TM domain-containing protein [Desulfurivibrio alkaliphilus]